jgi:ATP-dependent Clp endopeptidase proteolytic subunit ClpP
MKTNLEKTSQKRKRNKMGSITSITRKWYKAQLIKKGKAEVFIFDEIGMFGIEAKDFMDDIRALGDIKDLTVNINSPGGVVTEGLAIYNYLNSLDMKVTTKVLGIAASMASVIFMAGDERIMPESSLLMIHRPFGGKMGDMDDMESAREALKTMTDMLANIYAKRADIDVNEVQEMMKVETIMNGKEAEELGFVTEVIEEEMPMAATFNLDKLAYSEKLYERVSAKENTMSEEKKDDLPVEELPEVAEAEEVEETKAESPEETEATPEAEAEEKAEVEAEEKAEEKAEDASEARAEYKRFIARFGEAHGSKLFADHEFIEDATDAYAKLLKDELESAHLELARVKEMMTAGHSGVEFDGAEDVKADIESDEHLRAYAKSTGQKFEDVKAMAIKHEEAKEKGA